MLGGVWGAPNVRLLKIELLYILYTHGVEPHACTIRAHEQILLETKHVDEGAAYETFMDSN